MRKPTGKFELAPSERKNLPSPRRFRATGEFRPPKRGEFFLSGACIETYFAPNDLTAPYWIAYPICLMCGWEHEEGSTKLATVTVCRGD